MLRKIFLLVLVFALVVPCAYAKKPTPHTVMRVSDLSLCPTGRSCVDGSGNMKMGAATIAVSNPPAAANSAGVAGTIAWDANYIYVCIATNTWKRVAISTWP